MRSITTKFVTLLALALGPVFCAGAAQKVNPLTQINWPLVTGTGAPSGSCASSNYGQPYTNTANGNFYVCASTGWVLVAGGGGGGISGTGTTGFIPKFTGTTAIGNSAIDDSVTTANTITSTKPVAINDGTGVGGTVTLTEGTAATASSGKDILYADSTNHCILYSANGGSFVCLGTGSGGTTVDVLSNQRATGTQFHQAAPAEYIAVTAGTPVTIFTKTGAGVLTHIWFAAATLGYQFFEGTTINITINGEGSPYISTTLDAFLDAGYFGDGVDGPTNYFNALEGANGSGTNATSVGMYSKIPIPFSNGITISITPSQTTTIWWQVQGNTAPNTWPYTRKLWVKSNCRGPAGTLNLCGGSSHDAATANYGFETLANFAGSTQGRILSVYYLSDGNPGNVLTRFFDLEGNYRFFIDSFNWTWQANTAVTNGTTIIDSFGNLQTVTTGGTTGGTIPASFGKVSGATTSDGTVTWTATAGEPGNIWRASKPYSLVGMSFLDPNGNVQTVTTTGTTGASQPSYCTTNGCTTTDGTVVTTTSTTYNPANLITTGSEDLFLADNYGANQPVSLGANEIGTEFLKSSNTVAFFRFFLSDPMRFGHSFAIIRQNGDSSEQTFTGTTTTLQTVKWYSEDTN